MDETNPVFENFRNKMQAFGKPIRETTRKVSASKFLKRDDLEKRIEINARKITLLKNIIQAQQVSAAEMIKSLSESKDTTESVDLIKRVENNEKMIKSLSESSSIKGIEKEIAEIRESVTSIKDTLVKQQELEAEEFNRTRRELERKKRKERENLLEKTGKKLSSFLKSTTQKIVDPVKNIFVGIIQFFATLFFGKFLVNFTKFLSNPKNLNIVISITDFIAKNFDLIIGTIGLGTLAIAAFGFKLLGIGNILTGILTGNIFASPTARILGSAFGSSAATKGMPGIISKGTRTTNFGGAPIGSRFKGMFKFFSQGGLVPGVGNQDTIPAMLTPGEVVISKPAVQKIGAENLLRLNLEAGKTNKPKIINGRMYANQGGFAAAQKEFSKISLEERIRMQELIEDQFNDRNNKTITVSSTRKVGEEQTPAQKLNSMSITRGGKEKFQELIKNTIGLDADGIMPDTGKFTVDKMRKALLSSRTGQNLTDSQREEAESFFGNLENEINSMIPGTRAYRFRNEADLINQSMAKFKPVSNVPVITPPIEENSETDISSVANRINVPVQQNSPSGIDNNIVKGDLASPDESVLSTIGML